MEKEENKIIKEIKGKTIEYAEKRGLEMFDDKPYLDIHFTDGSVIAITSYYGDYTGKSEEEYPRYIDVRRKK